MMPMGASLSRWTMCYFGAALLFRLALAHAGYFAASLRTVVTFRIVPIAPTSFPSGTAAGDWPKLPRVIQYNSRLWAWKSSSLVRSASSFKRIDLAAAAFKNATCNLQSAGKSNG